MTGAPDITRPLRVADLPPRKATRFAFRPGPEVLSRIADELGLLGLRKLSFEGELSPMGKRDWRLTARLGATAQQACVVTLEPVTTRIDVPVERNYVAEVAAPDAGSETEMPEDDATEPLGSEIDLGAVVAEALILALPDYPRTAEAGLDNAQFTEPGKAAMTDEDARPFAGLAALRDQLKNGD